MTGYYVRVLRGERFESAHIDELTREELEWFIKNHPNDGWMWAKALIDWIQQLKQKQERTENK